MRNTVHMDITRIEHTNESDDYPPQPCLLTEVGRYSDTELLAVWLAGPELQQEALDHAAAANADCGGLRGLFTLSTEQRARLPGWSIDSAQRLSVALELVRRQLSDTLLRGDALTSPSDTLEYLQSILVNRRREIFVVVFLDTRHRVICSQEVFKGSIDGASVYPRVVAEKALLHGAAAVIVAHNHPSGVNEPSLADQAITRRLKEALALLEIRLLDHFVIGDGQAVSLASRGML